MLEQVDLSQKIAKAEYKSLLPELEMKLAPLRREAIQVEIPIMIVFEGWEASGKGTLINRLILNLDPRHFSVFSVIKSSEEEIYRPFLWRYWIRTPSKGRMAIFDRSWYSRVLADRVNSIVKRRDWLSAYHGINSFERQLADDGTVIFKFFLHISKKEQKERFKRLEKNPSTSWRVTKEDWRHHKRYEDYLAAAEDMLARTETGNAPWTIVEANDRRFAEVKVFQTVIRELADRVAAVKKSKKETKRSVAPGTKLAKISSSVLQKVDLSISISREDYFEQLKKYQNRIRDLEHEVYVKRLPVIILYEGWDAAGKGGNIKRLTQNMDPRGYEVIPISAPNDIEKKHHYMWRFWNQIPKAGHIAIFDRSWYGRVLVERVEQLCAESEWKRAYQEINEMEEQLTSFGSVVVKFWLHLDKDEQMRRFEERQSIPHKRWKITDEDWRNREKWDLYEEAVDEMLFRTSTPYAPWTIVESNSKHYARLKSMDTVIKAIEMKLKK